MLMFGRDRLSLIWNESKGKLRNALSPSVSPKSTDDDTTDDDDDEPPTKRAKQRRGSV